MCCVSTACEIDIREGALYVRRRSRSRRCTASGARATEALRDDEGAETFGLSEEAGADAVLKLLDGLLR